LHFKIKSSIGTWTLCSSLLETSRCIKMLGGSGYSHMKEETLAQKPLEARQVRSQSVQRGTLCPRGRQMEHLGGAWRCTHSDPGWSWPHTRKWRGEELNELCLGPRKPGGL
ncbi:hypothetical protein H1C71_001926, partial [Ictidomys tridecemlineatus]